VSVINQMLKDLDNRAPEQGQAVSPPVLSQKSSTVKIVLISLVVLLSLNALGYYIWSLEARVAKSTELQKQQLQAPQPPVSQLEASNDKLPAQQLQPVEVLSNKSQYQKPQPQKPQVQQQQASSEKLPIEKAAQTQVKPLPVSSEKPEVVNKVPAKIAEVIALPSINNSTNQKAGKMSVSRRQLSPQELVAKKLVRAEKAINANELTKAEQLFEEVLIIKPSHKEARKKLAALWFGRKSYQQAVNLLSQGIAIDRQNGELRLLKARIHLTQKQYQAAFTTLKVLPLYEQEEYQVMLVNVAQQIEQYPSAISAYQVLIKMQPYSGRWHLGLAIVYDKSSQFSLAINEYALALSKTDLSISSAKFAKQRLQALGE